MKITETLESTQGNYIFEYTDADSFDHLDPALCKQCYGICFCDGKLLIALGYFGKAEDTWGFVGGRVDPGETLEQTLRREVQEESNMEIVSFLPLGYQKGIKSDGSFSYQLRYVCKVKPFGPFVSDPANGVIKEIKLIDPAQHKEYIHWGKIGERLVERGLELLPKL